MLAFIRAIFRFSLLPRTQLIPLGAIATGLSVVPDWALAHTSERGFVLLLPTQYYLAGGAIAVGVSFLLLALVPSSWLMPGRNEPHDSEDRVPGAGIDRIRVITSCLSFLIILALAAIGFLGTRDPLSNLLPLTIWTIWWVGFPLLHAVFGNLWHYINPWSGPVTLLRLLLPRGTGVLPYPEPLGYWPAIIGFAAFAWFELISLAPEDPEILARAVVLYWAVTFVAALLFGEEIWLKRAECFSVFFGLIARLSPIVWKRGAAPRLAFPGNALQGREPLAASGVLFVLLTLSAVSFDGFSKTFSWMAYIGVNPLEFPGRSAVTEVNSAGLAGMWLLLAAGFVGSVGLGRLLCRSGPRTGLAAGALVYSIIPISLGYHLAHYLTVLLVNGQYALIALSDPFGLGWDLLSIQPFSVTTSFLFRRETVEVIWNVQSGAIIAGHVLAVLVAHRLSLAMHDSDNNAVLSQIPLALVMVGYTLFGLWLLATPTAA